MRYRLIGTVNMKPIIMYCYRGGKMMHEFQIRKALCPHQIFTIGFPNYIFLPLVLFYKIYHVFYFFVSFFHVLKLVLFS